MEIGSFIELEIPQGTEWFSDINDNNIARLNSGRAAIYYSLLLTNCKRIWIPYYQCECVRQFLLKHKIIIKYYHINERMEPVDIRQEIDDAVLLVNYFGMFEEKRLSKLISRYWNIILDNSQGFFCNPQHGCLNIYSARKFFGVPDGAYVIGKEARKLIENFPKGYSSDTSGFLLMRHEYGCEGRAYKARQKNEERLNKEDVCKMSDLTMSLLKGINYQLDYNKRNANFKTVCHKLNKLNTFTAFDFDNTEGKAPMVYPLLVEKPALHKFLLSHKHFQGRWWNYIADELPEDSFECKLSTFLMPITIDQRYGTDEIEELCNLILVYCR